MLELNINQPSANDITTLTIKRDFFLDSCQIELKPQEPNKEYHISQDLYVPMKMIFHCPKEAPAMSPTYLVVYCWDWMRYDPPEGLPGSRLPIISKNTDNSYNFNIPMDKFQFLFDFFIPQGTKYYRFNCWADRYSYLNSWEDACYSYDKTMFNNNFTKPLGKHEILVYNDGPYSPSPTLPSPIPVEPEPTTTPGGKSTTANQNVWQPQNWFQRIFAPLIKFFTK